MNCEGNIKIMRAEVASPVNYYLPVGDFELPLNKLLGKKISLKFLGLINCVACGKKIKKSFGQGFCYRCLQTVPEAAESVIRPELSKAHFGISRDMEWSTVYDLTDHYVYLAVACDLKVGVTRHHSVLNRWIDQGASFAIKLAHTPNRHIAGVIEVFLKRYIADRTNWQGMLKSCGNEEIDLHEEKKKALYYLPAELKKYACSDDTITSIDYPMLVYPLTVKSLILDKVPAIEGVLQGIKGQYLVFDGGTALNIRKHSGYYLQIICPDF